MKWVACSVRVSLLLAAPASMGQAAPAVAPLKATLISPDPDARLDRSRVERHFLGHPDGPASDGLQVALDEGEFELQAVDAAVTLSKQTAGSLEAARSAAQAAYSSITGDRPVTRSVRALARRARGCAPGRQSGRSCTASVCR